MLSTTKIHALAADAERLSGLSRKGHALPYIADAASGDTAASYEARFLLTALGAFGVYTDSTSDDMPYSLAFVSDPRQIGFSSRLTQVQLESVLVHEFTHWLQDVNGWMSPRRPTWEIEMKAYHTQAAWFRERGLVPTEVFPDAFDPAVIADRYHLREMPVF